MSKSVKALASRFKLAKFWAFRFLASFLACFFASRSPTFPSYPFSKCQGCFEFVQRNGGKYEMDDFQVGVDFLCTCYNMLVVNNVCDVCVFFS